MKSVAPLFILLVCYLSLQAQQKQVILIGIDGLGAYAFQKAKTPNLNALMEQGSWSMHARSVLPSSSAANWASMIMGAGPELHGFTTWGSKSPDLPSRELDNHGFFPTIISLLRQQKKQSQIGVIYEWDGIGYLFPKAAVNKEQHCDGDKQLTAVVNAYLETTKPDFLFIHFHDVDSVGHTVGHDTPDYYAAVERTDAYIGEIIETLKKTNQWERSVLLVSADHGGIDKGHGGKTMLEMEIPWIIAGRGIHKNHEIQESIMTFDTAATIAYLFGLKVPQVWIGRPVRSAIK